MSVHLKDPDAVLDYSVDWTAVLEDGESLVGSQWSVAPDATAGLAILGESAIGTVRAATVSGGRPGDLYRLTNRVTTDQGRTHDRSFLIRIEQR